MSTPACQPSSATADWPTHLETLRLLLQERFIALVRRVPNISNERQVGSCGLETNLRAWKLQVQIGHDLDSHWWWWCLTVRRARLVHGRCADPASRLAERRPAVLGGSLHGACVRIPACGGLKGCTPVAFCPRRRPFGASTAH